MVLNRVFGPCGVGWSYTYDQITVEPFTRKSGSAAFRAFIPKLELRVLWVVNDQETWSEPIPVAGSSINSEVGYAAKGAATSAISGAASHLGFQQLVYQGKLTERNMKDGLQEIRMALLEALAPVVRGRAAAIEGDLATDEDAQREEDHNQRYQGDQQVVRLHHGDEGRVVVPSVVPTPTASAP